MTRPLSLILAALFLLAAGSLSGNLRSCSLTSAEVPKTATVEIVLLNAPGINNQRSNWEIAYELRIANDAALWEAWKESRSPGGTEKRVGELIKEGVVKKAFRSAENRKARLQIPLSPAIQERLRNQPQDLVKLTPGKITAEEIKLSREREINSQSFQFYSVIHVYDGKLKKTLVIPASFTWPFANYPEARFEINVVINNDNSYSVNTSLPAKPLSE